MAVKTKRFINSRKSCSCSMPGVWRAVAYCDGAVVIFHSPRACSHVARSMDLGSHYRTLAEGQRERRETIPLLSSQLEEKHSIFGGAKLLKDCIDFAVAEYKPQCLVIANSCVAGVIGDDVEAVARAGEEQHNLPVLTVDCYGFLDGEYYQGYFEITQRLIERFFIEQEHTPDTALLLGDNGGPWGSYSLEVRRLLGELGVKVIGQFPGYVPIGELAELTRAQASIILGGYGQTGEGLEKIAAYLKKNYGLDYQPGVYPLGWRQTKEWIIAMGRLFKKEKQAEQLLVKEISTLEQGMQRFLPITKGKKTVLCLGRWLMYFRPETVLETIANLQLDLRGIVLLDGYDAKEREAIIKSLDGCTEAPIYSYDQADSLLAEAELILTTHELKDKSLKQIFIPMLPKAGVTGELAFMDAIVRTLCSRLNRGGVTYV